ncbi:hypothetical protein AA313_de0206313 [Arthrobotrys entomopaga]|nr:hypothetical protein AA313_de0206313 [Arthrobotrys entomopaga]
MDIENAIISSHLSEPRLLSEERQFEIYEEANSPDSEKTNRLYFHADAGDESDFDATSVGDFLDAEEEYITDSGDDNMGTLDYTVKIFENLPPDYKTTLDPILEENWRWPSQEPEYTFDDIEEMVSDSFDETSIVSETSSMKPVGNNNEISIEEIRLNYTAERMIGWIDTQNEIPLSVYAYQHRHQLWNRIGEWESDGRQFVEEVEALSKEQGMSVSQAENIISFEWQQCYDFEPLPYTIYKQILTEDEEMISRMRCHRVTVDGVDCDLLCRILEDNYVPLHEAASQLPINHLDRRDFKSYVVQVPFLLETYGVNHFFIALAFRMTFMVMRNLINQIGQSIRFQISALCIFENIGMSAYPLALRCLLGTHQSDIEPALALAYAKARESMRKTILRKHGQNHPKTLYLYANYASEMAKVPALRKQGESLAYSVLQKIKLMDVA